MVTRFAQDQIIRKLQKLDFLRREKEFEAQTFRIDSTHEYPLPWQEKDKPPPVTFRKLTFLKRSCLP